VNAAGAAAEPVKGFQLDLRDGMTLCASHVPGRTKPYLGIRENGTFLALAEFLSDADMDYLRNVLASRVFVIQPIDTGAAGS